MTTMRNSVQLIGRPGKDPEIKQIGNDRNMAYFSLKASAWNPPTGTIL